MLPLATVQGLARRPREVTTIGVTVKLGWRPQESFESGLRSTVAWYLGNRDWWGRIRSGVYRGERLGAG